MADVEILEKSNLLPSVDSMQAQLVQNHLSDKMEDLDMDEESPLGAEEFAYGNAVPGLGDGDMTGMGPDGSNAIGGLAHRNAVTTGTPLIILPVQSEGIPSSGSGLPLGRPVPPSPPAVPQGEELLKMLTQQLEYYFSKDNLSSDKYLLSQMDSANYVPISVLSNFNQVKRLTQDPGIILEALRASSVLQLDEPEEKVRSIPEKRQVLILREIPKETPKQELVALFSREGCPKCVTCEFADNNCWYVTFDSEESTQEAYSFLREKVKEFQGRPIRARIKGTTVQRSSGLPKPKHMFMGSNYNGGPSPQMSYYSPVMPWSPTPPTSSSSSPYFDPANYSQMVGGNGFTPPQQTPHTQVGVVNPSPSGGVHPSMLQSFANNGMRYPPAFSYMADRGGSISGSNNTPNQGNNRTGQPNNRNPNNRGTSGGMARAERDRAPSPPIPNGDGLEKDKSEPFKSGRSMHGGLNSSGGSGGAGGGKYKPDDRKIPRLKNTGRHGRSEGGEKVGDRASQRQQQPQPKLDTAHFPPLPTSGADSNVATPPSVTLATVHSLVTPNEDGQKTLSDIVKGGSRPSNIMTPPQQTPAPVISTSNGGTQNTLASAIVERNIPASSVKAGVPHTHSLPAPSGIVESQEPINSDAHPMGSQPVSSEKKVVPPSGMDGNEEGGANDKSDKSGVAVVSGPPRLSSVVSGGGGGGGSGGHTHPHSGKGAPASANQRPQRGEYIRPSHYKDKPYNHVGNKGYSRYSDREYSNKQARNPQVYKSDNRQPQNSTNTRGRMKGDQPLRNRLNNGPRPNHGKPSPKSFKKQFPSHSSASSASSPQAPPPPPLPASSTPSDPSTEPSAGQGANSGKSDPQSSSQSAASSQPPKKLSYAQMAQKRNSKELAEGVETSPNGGSNGKLPVTPSSSTSSSSAPPPNTSQATISTTPAISTQSTSTIITASSGTRSAASKLDVEVGNLSDNPGGVVSKTIASSPPSKDHNSVTNKGKEV